MWQGELKCLLLTFYTFRFFRRSFWKREALTGAKFIGFSVNESFLLLFFTQTPLVTDFQWWEGNVAELLTVIKEIPSKAHV